MKSLARRYDVGTWSASHCESLSLKQPVWIYLRVPAVLEFEDEQVNKVTLLYEYVRHFVNSTLKSCCKIDWKGYL